MPRSHLVRVLLITALANGVSSEDYDILSRIASEEGVFDILPWARMDTSGDVGIFYLPEEHIRRLREQYPY